MRTKIFFMICLFLGIGLTRLSAQKGQDGTTGSYSEWYDAQWSDPVFCDGILVDWLDATVRVHHKAHFLKGDWLSCFVQSRGTAVSQKTGEVFDIKEIVKQDNNVISPTNWEWVADLHFNAIGNRGSHYIVKCTLYWDGRVEGGISVCH